MTVRSPDGLVEVVVGADGVIRDVVISEPAQGRPVRELSRAVQAAVTAAADAAAVGPGAGCTSETFGDYSGIRGSQFGWPAAEERSMSETLVGRGGGAAPVRRPARRGGGPAAGALDPGADRVRRRRTGPPGRARAATCYLQWQRGARCPGAGGAGPRGAAGRGRPTRLAAGPAARLRRARTHDARRRHDPEVP